MEEHTTFGVKKYEPQPSKIGWFPVLYMIYATVVPEIAAQVTSMI